MVGALRTRFYVPPQQLIDYILHAGIDLLLRFGTIGRVFVVAIKYEVLVWHQMDCLFQHADAAQPGIEYADGSAHAPASSYLLWA